MSDNEDQKTHPECQDHIALTNEFLVELRKTLAAFLERKNPSHGSEMDLQLAQATYEGVAHELGCLSAFALEVGVHPIELMRTMKRYMRIGLSGALEQHNSRHTHDDVCEVVESILAFSDVL